MEQGTLGKRIAYHRKRLGMTQEQLAQRVGVSAQGSEQMGEQPLLPRHHHSAGACLHLRHQRG